MALRWHRRPELWAVRGSVETAMYQSYLTFVGGTEGLDETVEVLTAYLWAEILVRHPRGMVAARAFGVEMEALEFVAARGFPEGPLKLPRVDGKRQTPALVRLWWPICEAAVRKVLKGMGREAEKKLILDLSWAVHHSAYLLFHCYRKGGEEPPKESLRIA